MDLCNLFQSRVIQNPKTDKPTTFQTQAQQSVTQKALIARQQELIAKTTMQAVEAKVHADLDAMQQWLVGAQAHANRQAELYQFTILFAVLVT